MALVAVPLIAEALAALQSREAGAGVRILLYWPVDFGLIVLALAAFIGLNAHGLRRQPSGALLGALTGLAASAVWFGAAFLVVFQVHLWRGGQL